MYCVFGAVGMQPREAPLAMCTRAPLNIRVCNATLVLSRRVRAVYTSFICSPAAIGASGAPRCSSRQTA